MYAFEPTEEQKMLVESINRFSQNDLRPKAHDADEEKALPPKLIAKGWEIGYVQASVPEYCGGFGERSAVTGILAAEELAFGDLAGALAIMAPNLYVTPILLAGTEEQKVSYLPAVVENEWQPYTAALIEPTFDFDPNDLKTTARQEGEAYILDGKKTYVPFAANARSMIVYARVEDQTQGFIVPRDTPGLEVGERQKLLGIQALPVYQVTLKDVRLPLENRLGGPEGHAFAPILDAFRLAQSALAVGVARAALEYSTEYAKDREVFGVKVAQKQAIAFMIAEMATEIEAVRLLNWEAAWMMDACKPDAGKQAYLAATSAADMAMMVTDRAVQILGGHGYIREHPVEMWMRNARGIAMLNGLAII